MKVEHIKNTQVTSEAELLVWDLSISIKIGDETHVINLSKDQWKLLSEVAANKSRNELAL